MMSSRRSPGYMVNHELKPVEQVKFLSVLCHYEVSTSLQSRALCDVAGNGSQWRFSSRVRAALVHVSPPRVTGPTLGEIFGTTVSQPSERYGPPRRVRRFPFRRSSSPRASSARRRERLPTASSCTARCSIRVRWSTPRRRAVLDRPDAPDTPIVESVVAALDAAPEANALVIGVAPAGGALPDDWRGDIEAALRGGL